MRVVVEDVHVCSAGVIRLARERTHEMVVLDRREEEDLLTRLHVRSDADDELRVALEAFVHRKDPMRKPLPRMEDMQQLRPGLWHWKTRHPEWSSDCEWPQEVSSYAAEVGDEFLLF